MKLSAIYGYLFDEDEDARVCKDISDDACQETPHNFFLILASQLFAKLGDAFSNTKVVFPWLMQSVGAPAFLIGLLVPIRESGSLIPQLLIGGIIRQRPIRKWFFVLGATIQSFSLFFIALTSFYLTGLQAGIVMVALLILFSLARSLCSIASKDVKGKTIPRTRRGRLSGFSASIAGLITSLVAISIYVEWLNKDTQFGFLLLVASSCFLIAALFFSWISEYKGAIAGGVNGFKAGIKNLSLLKDDAVFRNFIIVRSFLMCSALAAPYFVLLASQKNGLNSWQSLAIFMAISGTSGLVSGPFWGKIADRSSRQLLKVTALITSILCALATAIAYFNPEQSMYLSMGLFFLLCLVHEGVRLGRKTYVLDIAKGNRRTDYVAVGNTLIGVLLLIIGLASASLAQYAISLVLVVFAVMGLIAFIVGHQLPET